MIQYILRLKLIDYIRIVGVVVFISAFMTYNQLIDIDERLFDTCWLIGLLIYLVKRKDFSSIILSIFVTFRLFDEMCLDDGIIDGLDKIEIILILIIAIININGNSSLQGS